MGGFIARGLDFFGRPLLFGRLLVFEGALPLAPARPSTGHMTPPIHKSRVTTWASAGRACWTATPLHLGDRAASPNSIHARKSFCAPPPSPPPHAPRHAFPNPGTRTTTRRRSSRRPRWWWWRRRPLAWRRPAPPLPKCFIHFSTAQVHPPHPPTPSPPTHPHAHRPATTHALFFLLPERREQARASKDGRAQGGDQERGHVRGHAARRRGLRLAGT